MARRRAWRAADPSPPADCSSRTGPFGDAAGCGGVSGGITLVSTQNPACHVNFASTDYANWDTFAAANPTYSTGQGWTPFIIADVAGSYNVTNIVLRNP